MQLEHDLKSLFCYETPIVSASVILGEFGKYTSSSLSVIQTTQLLNSLQSICCLQSIYSYSDVDATYLVIEVRPLYSENTQGDLTVAKPISIDHELVHTFQLKINRRAKIVEFGTPDTLIASEGPYGYMIAQSAISILIAWCTKEEPNCSFLSFMWKLNEDNNDLEPIYRSLGFSITYITIGDTFCGVCESARIDSLIVRDTSSYLHLMNAQNFIWNIKKDFDENQIYSYRDEQKLLESKKNSDTVIEALHDSIRKGNTLLFALSFVIICLSVKIVFF